MQGIVRFRYAIPSSCSLIATYVNGDIPFLLVLRLDLPLVDVYAEYLFEA